MTSELKKTFLKQIQKNWYPMSADAVPLFLNTTSFSGMVMGKILGYGYRSFILRFDKKYGTMHYLKSDLKRLWKIIQGKVKNDPSYLKKVKKRYEEIFQKQERHLVKILKAGFKDYSGQDLFHLFLKAIDLQRDAVGIAHIIEPIGLVLEKDFKKLLFKAIPEKKAMNQVYVLLAAPTQPSFAAQEEQALSKISCLRGKKKNEALQKHLEKYFWLQNSYAGPKTRSIRSLKKQSQTKAKPKETMRVIQRHKQTLIKQYKFSVQIQKMSSLIGFTAVWQDERKANILKSISYLGKVIKEISQRIRMDLDLLYYLSLCDLPKVNSLDDIKLLKKDLVQRKKGAFFWQQKRGELVATGNLYRDFLKTQKKLEAKLKFRGSELHGSIANTGNVIGQVSICKTVSSIPKVKKGNILVASMTRPELMPAIKKAAAIVTDEGGITCHASIVARELNIPAVIGTRIATQVLKDGMLVEVKGNHGVVKILT